MIRSTGPRRGRWATCSSRAGCFLLRGGWLGRAEQPNYLGQGATSVEYFLDGVAYLPVGPDSVAVDAGFPALSLLDRVEVERGPNQLRVYLFTRRHDRLSARTRIGVSSGDRSLSRYLGAFERRYPSGIGLSAGAEYFGVNAPQGSSGASKVTNGWVQLGWVPSPRYGVQAQLMIQAADRDTLFGAGEGAGRDTLSPAVHGRRTDLQLRAMWRGRSDATGLAVDGYAARTSWASDDEPTVIPGEDTNGNGTVDGDETGDLVIDPPAQDIGLFGAIVSWRQPTWSAQLRAFHQTEDTVRCATLVGWAPCAGERVDRCGRTTPREHGAANGDRASG